MADAPPGPRPGTRRRAAAAVVLTAVLLVTAGCAEEVPADRAGHDAITAASAAASAPFDRAASDRFLLDAVAAGAAGDTAGAEAAYRAAALAWPDSVPAWQGLHSVAEQRGDQAAAEAASFVLRRLYLFPSGALGVQREYRAALLGYIDEQAAAPDANPTTLVYARALAGYYTYRYAERGTYEPPEGYLDLRWADVPAAVASSALLLVYGSSLVSGAAD